MNHDFLANVITPFSTHLYLVPRPLFVNLSPPRLSTIVRDWFATRQRRALSPHPLPRTPIPLTITPPHTIAAIPLYQKLKRPYVIEPVLWPHILCCLVIDDRHLHFSFDKLSIARQHRASAVAGVVVSLYVLVSSFAPSHTHFGFVMLQQVPVARETATSVSPSKAPHWRSFNVR